VLVYIRRNCASIGHGGVSDVGCGEIQRVVFREVKPLVWYMVNTYLEGFVATFTKVETVAISTLNK
jgi:hypothetical protein